MITYKLRFLQLIVKGFFEKKKPSIPQPDTEGLIGLPNAISTLMVLRQAKSGQKNTIMPRTIETMAVPCALADDVANAVIPRMNAIAPNQSGAQKIPIRATIIPIHPRLNPVPLLICIVLVAFELPHSHIVKFLSLSIIVFHVYKGSKLLLPL